MDLRLFVVIALACACRPPAVSGDDSSGTTAASSSGTSGSSPTTGPTSGSSGDTGDPPETATVVHSFGDYWMDPFVETEPCVQWTLENEQALYVNAVTLVNDGGFHHSNWFAVPEEVFVGDDGYWSCGERNYDELTAALEGTVLFAQSTQSHEEIMRLPAGAVIKIPPRHKIVAGVHLLNLGSTALASELRIALDIIHPRDVSAVLTPLHLDYRELSIPPQTRSRFTGNCAFADKYEQATNKPLDLKLYYVLPHYHVLGESFGLQILGGPRDGEVLFQLDGFNAGANGKAFDPPVDLAGADGLRFACGFDNWFDKTIGYGIGDQEMCMMLGLADSRVMVESRVVSGSTITDVDGDVVQYEAGCDNYALFKHPSQSPPTAEEKNGPLYVPPADPGDVDLEPTKDCVDSDPAAEPVAPATLSTVRDAIFTPSCTFSSCHDDGSPAAGLDLQTAAGLGDRLRTHPVVADTDLALVAPGDPEGSWLYRLLAECEPQNASGQVVRHMPFNAPTLLPDPLVAAVRSWIADGALDD